MTDIVTLTMNPSIDISTSAEHVVPFHKMRCASVRYDPGGGGINVARVLRRFGADVAAIYPSGGPLGHFLQQLITREGIPTLTIPISDDTRADITVLEAATCQQYRFVLSGPRLTEGEWRACMNVFASLGCRARFAVTSGSLPPGVPDDFYGRIAAIAKQAGALVVVDASGPSLRAALETGVYLVKPSLREFKELTGTTIKDERDCISACRSLIAAGKKQLVALTLGERGALLVTVHQAFRAPALPVKPVSIVGAGDSFLGVMLWSLSNGHSVDVAFRYGVAGGTAALLVPGTELCRREDVERLVSDVTLQPV